MYEIFEQLMKERGENFSDVARAIGGRASTFTDWRAGRYTPKQDKLKKIADHFGVSVEYLTTGVQSDNYYLNEETAKAAQEIFDNPELRLLFDEARDADPEDLKTVHQMLLALKRKENGEV